MCISDFAHTRKYWLELICNLKRMWDRAVECGANNPFPTSCLPSSGPLARTLPIFKLRTPHFDLDYIPLQFHDSIVHSCDTIALKKTPTDGHTITW